MNRKKIKSITFSKENYARITYLLICGCIAMAFFYALNVYSIISRTVAVEKLDTQAAHVSAAVQNLDSQYIALTTKITPAMAKQFGLSEGAVSAYIPRTPSLGSARGLISEL